MPRELQQGGSKIRVMSNVMDVFLKPVKKGKQRPIFRPSWDFTVLVFRPIPYYDRKLKTWSGLVMSDGSDSFGEWYGSGFIVGVINCGRKSARCILVHRSESMDVLQSSPIYVLSEYLNSYKRVKQLMAEGNQADARRQLELLNNKIWQIYSMDTSTSVEVRQAAFLQCPVLAVRSRPYERLLGIGENDPLPLILLVGSAMAAFEEAIKSDVPGSETVLKNVIDFKHGQFVEIGRKGYDKTVWFPTTGVPSENYYSGRTFAKYEKRDADLSQYAKVLASKIESWDEMFLLPDADEQIAMMIWAGINPIYLYAALAEMFKLPEYTIRRARQLLGEQTQVFVPTPVKQPEAVEGPVPTCVGDVAKEDVVVNEDNVEDIPMESGSEEGIVEENVLAFGQEEKLEDVVDDMLMPKEVAPQDNATALNAARRKEILKNIKSAVSKLRDQMPDKDK